jgi:dolichyl-phosphate-mannose--protein O-mannosyl transferase
VIIHEILHAIAFYPAARRMNVKVSFGMNWKALMPHVKLSGPISAGHYKIGLLTPAMVLGVIPLVLALSVKSWPLFLFAAIMLLAALGDFFALWAIRRVPARQLVVDHPTRVGCEIFHETLH